MSDESTPPPLRLKPRLRSDGDANTAPAAIPPPVDSAPLAPSEPAPVQPAATPAATEPPAKLRLKPKLFAETNAAAAPTAPAEPPAIVPPSAPPPTPAIEAAPAPATSSIAPTIPPVALPAAAPAAGPGEPPKFKLKPKVPEAASSTVSAASATPPPAAPPPSALSPNAEPEAANPTAPARNTPPPFPLVAAPGSPARNFPPPVPKVPHVRAPAGSSEEELAKSAASKKGSSKRVGLLVGLLAVVCVAGGAVYRFWLKPVPPPVVVAPAKPKPKPVAPTSTPAEAPASSPAAKLTPSATINEIAAAPGNALNKAQSALAARRSNEQDRVDALANGDEPSDARALATPPPSTFTPKKPVTPPTTATSQLSPGITVTTTATDIAGAAAPAFRAWVANAKINGVFQGNPPRALINGRVVRAGQSVDDTLGIVFASVDMNEKTITFRDASGATVSRRY